VTFAGAPSDQSGSGEFTGHVYRRNSQAGDAPGISGSAIKLADLASNCVFL